MWRMWADCEVSLMGRKRRVNQFRRKGECSRKRKMRMNDGVFFMSVINKLYILVIFYS